MAYPTGNSFPPQFPQAPQPSPFAAAPAFPAAAPLGGFNQPTGLPPAGGGFGLPPGGGLGQPQDSFAPQQAPGAAAPQPGFAPPAGPDGTEGFADKNASLSTGGWASKVYSLPGLATGAAILGSVVLGHRYFAGKWFPWSTIEGGAKEGIDQLTQEVTNKVSTAFKALNIETHGKFIDHLTGAPAKADIEKAEKLVKPNLDELEELVKHDLKDGQDAYTNFVNAFKTPLQNAKDGKALTKDAAKTAKTDFTATHTAFNDKVASQFKTEVAPKPEPTPPQPEPTPPQPEPTPPQPEPTPPQPEPTPPQPEPTPPQPEPTPPQPEPTPPQPEPTPPPAIITAVKDLKLNTQASLTRLPQALKGIRNSAYTAQSLQETKAANSKFTSVFAKLKTQLNDTNLAENEQNAVDGIEQAHKKLITAKHQHLQDPAKNPFDRKSLANEINTANESYKTEISSKLQNNTVNLEGWLPAEPEAKSGNWFSWLRG